MKERDAESLEQQQEHLDQLRARINAAKIAYMNRTPFETEQEVSYDALKAIAQQFIDASYAYQKAKYGSVKARISVAKLLRR